MRLLLAASAAALMNAAINSSSSGLPSASELLHTTYDMWHSMGTDLAPYTRLCTRLRQRILGEPTAPDPVAATFSDGVINQAILDNGLAGK